MKKSKKEAGIFAWLVNQSWFMAAALMLGFLISGTIKSKEDFLEALVFCLLFWLFDFLFFKKFGQQILYKIQNRYKKITGAEEELTETK